MQPQSIDTLKSVVCAYGDLFERIALKNKPFMALAASLHRGFCAKLGPGKLAIQYQIVDKVGTKNVPIPMPFSSGDFNCCADKLALSICFIPGEDKFMTLYFIADEDALFVVRSVEAPIIFTPSYEIASIYDNIFASMEGILMVVIGDTNYCGK